MFPERPKKDKDTLVVDKIVQSEAIEVKNDSEEYIFYQEEPKNIKPSKKIIKRCQYSSLDDTYAYINQLRQSTGMIPLKINYDLEHTAQSHSDYLFENRIYRSDSVSGHAQSEYLAYFSGRTPRERMWNFNYIPKYYLGEGISYQGNTKQSVRSLFTAIYHRFGLLNIYHDEIGLGYRQYNNSECTDNLVHNNGNGLINSLCQNHSYTSGWYYYKVCKDEEFRIEKEEYLRAKYSVASANPKVILWPAHNSKNNSRHFQGENPDPMPYYAEVGTGNPVSIEFNKFYFEKNEIEMKSFHLFDKYGNEIYDTEILDKKEDPNERFTRYQFALFPIKTLEKYMKYTAKFRYYLDGIETNIIWNFTTGENYL